MMIAENTTKITLFENEENCCGCGACMASCPKTAITMQENEYGFLYPVVDEKKCIHCFVCKEVCDYQTQSVKRRRCTKVVAAVANREDDLLKSASGGVFSSVARAFIKDGGVVVGCALINRNGVLCPEHIVVDSEEELYLLQGSKYVQSSMNKAVFTEIKKHLKTGRSVLFSGTPCQVAALRKYTKDHFENLYTMDIICHGVPSAKMFRDYLEELGNRKKGVISDFKFRDKSAGWGMKGSYVLKKHNGKKVKKVFPSQLSSYFQYFLNSYTYRTNCYTCKYACGERVGDITIGDFWGIGLVHPEYLKANGGNYDEKKGISCVLINSVQGNRFIEKYAQQLDTEISDWDSVAKKNAQLNQPSKRTDGWDKIMNLYREKGYAAVDRYYRKRTVLKRFVYKIWNYVPYDVQHFIKTKVLH